MYSYEKNYLRFFRSEREIQRESSSRIFILIDNANNRIVRKISDVEGVNKNGRDKLRKEINFLEYFHNTGSSKKYPHIYNYEINNSFVYYDMEYIKGKFYKSTNIANNTG